MTLNDGNYGHVPADTLLKQRKAVDVAGLYDPDGYRARLLKIEGMPMFMY